MNIEHKKSIYIYDEHNYYYLKKPIENFLNNTTEILPNHEYFVYGDNNVINQNIFITDEKKVFLIIRFNGNEITRELIGEIY